MVTSAVSATNPASDALDITPLSPTIGAEIHGVNLAEPLSPGLRAEIYGALLSWKVIFFRDQRISTEQHLDFSRNFGELEVHPFSPVDPVHPEVLKITHDETAPGRENLWHSDVTWRAEPSLGSVLHCLECPPVGGDTLFADMYAAFDGLDADVAEAATGAVAVHDFEGFRRAMRKRGVSEEKIAAFDAKFPNPHHPVIRTHPDTGKNGIYVNSAFTKRILGMSETESEELLRALYTQASIPEYQCRFRWSPGSVAFWDNRACQHYATSDYWPSVRRMERVTIIGDTPFFDKESLTRRTESCVDPRFKGQLAGDGRKQQT